MGFFYAMAEVENVEVLLKFDKLEVESHKTLFFTSDVVIYF